MDALVTLSNLDVGFPGPTQPLLAGLQAELPARELVCLMGANGSGKTTLMRTLLGLHPPLRGHVHLQGQDVCTLSRPHMARTVSMVFPGRVIAGHLRVEELVALGRVPYTAWHGRGTRTDRRMATRALGQVDADNLQGRHVAELSDGERQRVLIARALAQDTPLLLLDEPTAFLDIANRIQIMRLLQHLVRHEGKTILMSTHDLDLVLHHADLVWLIESATRTMTIGAPEELMLSGALARTLAGDAGRFDPVTGTLRHLPAEGPAVIVRGNAPVSVWTRRALQRRGFRVSETPVAAAPDITCGRHGDIWTVRMPQGSVTTHTSLHGLLRALSAQSGDSP